MKQAIMRPGYTQALPYSHAVVASGRMLYISGQGPVGLDGKVIEGDFPAQCRQALANLAAVAEAAGTDLSRAVKVNVYLKDPARDFPTFNEIYREVFTGDRPARTTIGCDLPNMLIEVDAILALDD